VRTREGKEHGSLAKAKGRATQNGSGFAGRKANKEEETTCCISIQELLIRNIPGAELEQGIRLLKRGQLWENKRGVWWKAWRTLSCREAGCCLRAWCSWPWAAPEGSACDLGLPWLWRAAGSRGWQPAGRSAARTWCTPEGHPGGPLQWDLQEALPLAQCALPQVQRVSPSPSPPPCFSLELLNPSAVMPEVWKHWRVLLWGLVCNARHPHAGSSPLPPVCAPAVGGAQQGVQVGASAQCPGCQGSGLKVSIRQLGPNMIQQMQHVCNDCRGSGYARACLPPLSPRGPSSGIRVTAPLACMPPFALLAVELDGPCSGAPRGAACACGVGAGEVINEKDKCPQCKGSKVVQEKKLLDVHVEKGMQHGQKITFQGEADEAVSASRDTHPGCCHAQQGAGLPLGRS